MSREQHQRILSAYLGRISIQSLEDVLDARREGAHASLNLGNSAQLRCHHLAREATDAAIDSLIDHDLGLIDNVLKEES